jgi:hypothetical protein
MIDSDKGRSSILTMNLLDIYCTGWEVGCQVKFVPPRHQDTKKTTDLMIGHGSIRPFDDAQGRQAQDRLRGLRRLYGFGHKSI